MSSSGADKGNGLSIGIVASCFNKTYVDALLEGAKQTLLDLGVNGEDIEVLRVPGVYEIPLGVRIIAPRCDAVIVAGCVIRGETEHFNYVVDSCRDGVLHVMLETNVPVATAVLTVDNREQAQARCGGEVNRGTEAASAAVDMAKLMRVQN